MLRNYLTIAFRALKNQKIYSTINIFGLGVGLATCILILLYIQNETSYDQFHENADRIFQPGLRGVIGGQFLEEANTATPMGPVMMREYPEVENFVRVKPMGRVLMAYETNRFYEEDVYWADSSFFDVFSFQMLQGNPETALRQPNTIVLTESVAQKYFGTDNPIGKVIEANNTDNWTVSGVIEDIPDNSHIQIDVLVSMESVIDNLASNWLSHHLYTYLLLTEGANVDALRAKLIGLADTYAGPEFEQFAGVSFAEAKASGLEFEYYLQPLTGLYLEHVGNGPIGLTSDIRYVYILGAIALFILILACINFMNLSTARSAQRAQEVGLRKVLGSNRRWLIFQFLGESVLIASFALLVAIVLIIAGIPLFNAIAGKTLMLSGWTGLMMAGILVVMTLVSGLLAGIYPAFCSFFFPANRSYERKAEHRSEKRLAAKQPGRGAVLHFNYASRCYRRRV